MLSTWMGQDIHVRVTLAPGATLTVADMRAAIPASGLQIGRWTPAHVGPAAELRSLVARLAGQDPGVVARARELGRPVVVPLVAASDALIAWLADDAVRVREQGLESLVADVEAFVAWYPEVREHVGDAGRAAGETTPTVLFGPVELRALQAVERRLAASLVQRAQDLRQRVVRHRLLGAGGAADRSAQWRTFERHLRAIEEAAAAVVAGHALRPAAEAPVEVR